MAYNFLSLTNEICSRLNETRLTSANFAEAKNFYNTVKESVNASLRDINHQQYNYPFNHNSTEIILDIGSARYPIPQNAKLVDFDTIRILRDDALSVSSAVLTQITYNTYIKNHLDAELNTSDVGGIPRFVARTQTNDFVIAPKPDREYTLEMEYFVFPADLALYDDVPTVPEMFKHIIIDGAMYHCYMFRDNAQSAAMAKQKFDEGLKAMRSLVANDYVNVTDTRVSNLSTYPVVRVN
jgi:hypothetical protein